MAAADISKRRTAAQRGTYYKHRTKKFLETAGYEVAYMERVHWIPSKSGKMVPIKQDQFGADLLAVSPEELIFIQVKFGSSSAGKAAREFARFQFPPWAQRWIMVWQLRAREPEIIDCSKMDDE